MAELARVDPIGAGTRYLVTMAGAVIGRARSSEIQIEDAVVSRRHVRVACTEDLGAMTGCHVDGVPSRFFLRIGDLATHDAPLPDDDDEDGGAPATAQLRLS